MLLGISSSAVANYETGDLGRYQAPAGYVIKSAVQPWPLWAQGGHGQRPA